MAQHPSLGDSPLTFVDLDKDPETIALARSTEKALRIIMPWCHAKYTLIASSTEIAKDIREQAMAYARVIDFSIASSAAWWNEISVDMMSLSNDVYMGLRGFQTKMFDRKWKKLRNQYGIYANEMGAVVDRYPVFRELRRMEPNNPQHEDLATARPQAAPSLAVDSSVGISVGLSKSYLSVSLSHVQLLEESKCLFVLRVQRAVSPTPRRSPSLQLKWRFLSFPWKHGRERPPSVIDIVPKNNSQTHMIRASKEAPFHVQASIRTGPRETYAKWTIQAIDISGIPPHFFIATVVDYENNNFMTKLDVVAKRFRSDRDFWCSSHAQSEWLSMDVDKLLKIFQITTDELPGLGSWQDQFSMISGEEGRRYLRER